MTNGARYCNFSETIYYYYIIITAKEIFTLHVTIYIYIMLYEHYVVHSLKIRKRDPIYGREIY